MQSFSSPGAGPAKTNSNAADSAYHPHPTTPPAGPATSDRMGENVNPILTGDVAYPGCDLDFHYS